MMGGGSADGGIRGEEDTDGIDAGCVPLLKSTAFSSYISGGIGARGRRNPCV